MVDDLIVTTDWLREQGACQDGVDRFVRLYGDSAPLTKVVKGHIKDGTLDYAMWLIVRKMTYSQRVRYALFAAEQVIGNYEAVYPDNPHPRNAIGAVRACIEDPSPANMTAALSAASSAFAAASSADAAASSAWSAARSAGGAAGAAGDTEYAAEYAVLYAVMSVGPSTAMSSMRITILQYGLSLMKEDSCSSLPSF